MQLYKYKGYDANGKKIEGELLAKSPDEVERKASANQVTVIAIYPIGAKGHKQETSASSSTSKLGGFMAKKASDADIAVVLRDLAVMAETGVPFVEAIDAVTATARTKPIRQGLLKFKEEVVGGRTLSIAMRSAKIFPTIVCEMVKVAEEGGRLDQALASAATYVERAASLKKKIMNAMLYPIVLMVIAAATVGVLIIFVLPRFAGIFKSMKAELPATTKFMLGFGETLKSQPYILVGTLVGGFFLIKFVMGHPTLNKPVHRLLLKIPVLGELLKRLALSRAMQSVATLTSSNVSLMSALEHGANVAGNPVISEAIMRARVGVEHGGSLADSMAATRVFPLSLVQMIGVGERTGRLATLMRNTANYMEEDVDARLKALISIVEPLMIVVMGTIVGTITLSIIIPMYSVIENVK